jgi:hypothetical protein
MFSGTAGIYWQYDRVPDYVLFNISININTNIFVHNLHTCSYIKAVSVKTRKASNVHTVNISKWSVQKTRDAKNTRGKKRGDQIYS